MDGFKIDTVRDIITSKTGGEYPYALEKKQAWNVGLRRHAMQLTGNIQLTFPNKSWNVFASFEACKAAILRYEESL